MGGQASEAIGRSVVLVVQSSGWQDLTCDYGIALAASRTIDCKQEENQSEKQERGIRNCPGLVN